MMTVEEFILRHSDEENTTEGKLARVYQKKYKQYQSMQSKLLQCLEIEEQKGQLMPIFDQPRAKDLYEDYAESRKQVLSVAGDINELITLLGVCQNVAEYSERIHRMKRMQQNAASAVKTAKLACIKGGRAENEDELVQKSLDKKERLDGELGPKIEAQLADLKKINQILDKYGDADIHVNK